MVKRKKALKGAKGSALFMVICIMAILMVVAITAMAMVSLAYTRSLQNYTSSQSYVTAVNALEMIAEISDNKATIGEYGESDSDVTNSISAPLYKLFSDAHDEFKSSSPDVSDIKPQYAEISFPELEGSGIVFVPYEESTGKNVKYQILANTSSKASVKPKDSIFASMMPDSENNKVNIKYGERTQVFWTDNNGTTDTSDDTDWAETFQYALVKISVKVQSGAGDAAQIREVSTVREVALYQKKKKSNPNPGSNPGGPFTQAVQTMGKYTSGTGMNVVGGISAKGGGGSFAGLKGNTSTIYINGDFTPKDSGHDGEIAIGAGQQITVNGKLTIDNNFKFNSTYDETKDTGGRPFIYCDEIAWTNSNIPTGTVDILTKNGGTYGRDNNTISGTVLSGGDLKLEGNNLNITGEIIVDGNVDIASSITGTGTIYYTGTINKSATSEENGVKKINGVTIVEISDETVFDILNPAIDEATATKIVTTPTGTDRTYNVATDKSVFGKFYEDGDPTKNVTPAEKKPDAVSNPLDPATASATLDQKNSGQRKVITIDTDAIVAEGCEPTIYLAAGSYENMEIVVTGSHDVKIYQDGNVTMNGCRIWSKTVKDKVEAGETIDVTKLADEEGYSKIYWNIDKNAELNMGTGGGGNLFNAYIYGPEAGIMQTTGGDSAGPYVKIKDEFGNEKNMKTWLMGAVVGNDITMCDGSSGIIFINPYGSGSGSGDKPPVADNPDLYTDTVYNLNSGIYYYTNR